MFSPGGLETRNHGGGVPYSFCLLPGRHRLSAVLVPRLPVVLTAWGSGAGCSASHHLGREQKEGDLEPGDTESWMDG